MAERSSNRIPINAPSPEEAAAEASSRASGKGSEASEGFVADPGPAFDPERAAERPGPEPPPELEQVDLEEWEEDVLASLLRVQGRLLHAGIGAAEEDWLYTEIDLAAICPPLTRICNRYPAVRQYARHADPLALFFALSGYATRSLLERREAIAELVAAEETEVPIEPLAPEQAVPVATPAPQRPPAFPGAAAASSPARAGGDGSRRPGEAADVDLEQVEWQVRE